jgi:hypothetical protein
MVAFEENAGLTAQTTCITNSTVRVVVDVGKIL